MSDVIFLGDHARVKPSLVSRFKKAADTIGISVYVAAPLVVAMGMTMPGHAGAALVIPLLGMVGGILGATAMPAVSAVLGAFDIHQSFSKAQAAPQNENKISSEVVTIKEKKSEALGKQKTNQTVSVAAYALAAMVMAGGLMSGLKGEGVERHIPFAFASTVLGFYFGRRAYKSASDVAVYDAAIPAVMVKQERNLTPP